jgi:c-di-GMP-binding flagellar brake protein YcgR
MAESEKQRQAFRVEVNEPVVITLPDAGRKMGARLLDISEGGCRLRARGVIPRSGVSFGWKGPSGVLELRGEMVGARVTKNKSAEFHVHFEMPQVEKDRLVAELHEIQRRVAFKAPEPALSDEDRIGRAKRKAYRAPVKFPVSFKSQDKLRDLAGTSHDLSIGGMLLISPEELEPGSEIEVEFTLPLDAVELGGEQREVVEQTPFGPRKVKKLVAVKPFQPVSTSAKVIKRVGAMTEGVAYGLQFLDLAPFTAEEIARFVHAFQLTQVRRVAAAAESRGAR